MAGSRNEQLQFCSRRSSVYSCHGAVATSQPLASEVGLRVLRDGGNAVDSAIAIAAALGVTEPCSTGLGGDAFILYYNADTRRVHALNGSGRSSAQQTLNATLERVVGDEQGLDALPGGGHSAPWKSLPALHGATVTVPGAAACWCDAMDAWGSWPLARVLQPAVELAQQGFPVAPITAHAWAAAAPTLNSALLLKGKAPSVGEIWRNDALANTMKTLGREGKRGFYEGRVAEAIANSVQLRGGFLTIEDLAAHTSSLADSLSVRFRGVDVHEHPPNGQVPYICSGCLSKAIG